VLSGEEEAAIPIGVQRGLTLSDKESWSSISRGSTELSGQGERFIVEQSGCGFGAAHGAVLHSDPARGEECEAMVQAIDVEIKISLTNGSCMGLTLVGIAVPSLPRSGEKQLTDYSHSEFTGVV